MRNRGCAALVALALSFWLPGAALGSHSYDDGSADAVLGAGCDPGDVLSVNLGSDAVSDCLIDDGDGACCRPIVAATCSIFAVSGADPRTFDLDGISLGVKEVDFDNLAALPLTFSIDDKENAPASAPPDNRVELFTLPSGCGIAVHTLAVEGMADVVLAGPPPPPQAADDDLDAYDDFPGGLAIPGAFWTCDQEADDPADDICVFAGAAPGAPGPGTTWDGGDIYRSALACAGPSSLHCDDVTGLLIEDECDVDAILAIIDEPVGGDGAFLFSVDQDSVPGCTLNPGTIYFSPCDGVTPPSVLCSDVAMGIAGLDLDALGLPSSPPLVPALGAGPLSLLVALLVLGATVALRSVRTQRIGASRK